jgi:hypothetical protein
MRTQALSTGAIVIQRNCARTSNIRLMFQNDEVGDLTPDNVNFSYVRQAM